MNEIVVKPGTEINLGKRGEHLARCVVFDISDWKKIYGEGRAHLLHQRNGDNAPYPCVVEMIDNKVLWTLNEVDLDVAGRGRAELQYFVGEARVKSETWFTRTDFAMNNEGPVPDEPAENWLDTMLELGTQTQDNAEAADDSAKAAQDSASAAAASAEAAKNSEEYTREIAEGVVAEAEQKILEHVTNAAASAESASEDSMSAKESAENAAASEEVAKEAEQAAKEAQEAAEKARDEASAIAGGDFATNAALDSHTDNVSNPHNVTKSQVGLGNVPNVATNNQTPTYTAATSLSALKSGEKLSVAFGKIAKATSDLISHLANTSNPHGVTAAQVGAVPTTRKVNGKALSADITLSAADVGAVNQSAVYYGSNDNKNADDLDVGFALLSNKETLNPELYSIFGTFAYVLTYCYGNDKSQKLQIAFDYYTGRNNIATRTLRNGSWGKWVSFATTDYAVNKAGDTITGRLNFQKVNNGSARIHKNHSTGVDYGLALTDEDASGKTALIKLSAQDDKVSFVNNAGKEQTIYHEGNKPTAADVGAVAESLGIKMIGDVTTSNYKTQLGEYSRAFRITSDDCGIFPTTYAFGMRIKSAANGSYDFWLVSKGGSNTWVTFTADGAYPTKDVWRKFATTDYAVNKAGDTMTGALNMKIGGGEGSFRVNQYGSYVYANKGDYNNGRALFLGNLTEKPNDATALSYAVTRDGANTYYDILHTGNVIASSTDITAGSSASWRQYLVYE